MNNTEPPKPYKPLSRRGQFFILVIICVGAIGAAGGAFFYDDQKDEVPAAEESTKTSDAFQPTPEQWAGLKIASVVQMTFHSQQTTDGKIAINDDTTTPVFSPYSGRVVKLMVKAGDVVKKNDPLFAIEATEFVQAQNDIVAASTSLKAAKTELDVAIKTEKRQHDLYEAEGTPLKTWQQSQADLAAAQATFRSAEAAYAEARNHLHIFGKSDADIDALENAVDAQQMSAEVTVNAPRDGTVVQRQIGLGQNIQAGASNPVFTIGDLSTVWLIANVREADAHLVHVDAPVEVHILALPDQTFKAKLSYVAAAVDPTTHRLPVRAEVDNADGSLKPEMFATFNIITGDDAEALAVPEKSVVYEGTAAHVWLAKDDKTITLKSIRPGRINNGMVEILDGLTVGDKIVTSGALFIDRAAAGD